MSATNTYFGKYPNGQIRFIGVRLNGMNIGSEYILREIGSPCRHNLYDIHGNLILTEHFWPSGKTRGKYVLYVTKDRPYRYSRECDKKGKEIRYIQYDTNGRRHGPRRDLINGKVVVTYAYKGVEVPEKFYFCPELLTKEDILNERNTEVRRVYIEMLGLNDNGEKYLDMFDHELIHEENGNSLFLVDLNDVKLGLIRLICPSTAHKYFHFVPNDLTTVGAVKCWMFGLSGNNFQPIAEA